MAADGSQKKIAVIGGGISGIVAAYLLSTHYSVTLFEAGSYLGGHTNTIVIPDGPDAGTPVDTGFIVCNPVNYPLFYRFLDLLGIARQRSDMSFSFYDEGTGLAYNGPTLKEFLATPENLLNPRLLWMLWERRCFAKRAIKDLRNEATLTHTLYDYLREQGRSEFFLDSWVVPLSAAIWSSSALGMKNFPALTFLRFFQNHGILNLDIPQWETVRGGSFEYVKAFQKGFSGECRIGCRVEGVRRHDAGVTVRTSKEVLSFNDVVIATHADTALSMLEDPDPVERELLGSWEYSRNRTVLHTDESLLPMKRRAWSSWNYVRPRGAAPTDPVGIIYHMNRLQRLKTLRNYFVSLNPITEPDPSKIVYETLYTHPIYSLGSVKSQEGIRQFNGTRNTSYCGAYLGYGFHEDGVRSAVEAVKRFGVSL